MNSYCILSLLYKKATKNLVQRTGTDPRYRLRLLINNPQKSIILISGEDGSRTHDLLTASQAL